MTPTSNSGYSQTSPESTLSSSPTKLPEAEGFDLDKFRDSNEAQKLVAWVQEEWSKSKSARQRKQLQWFTNMAMFYGQQWVEQTRETLPTGYRDRLQTPKRPYYHQRKVVNRTRSFVRWELSKFLSQVPSATAVPASSEDQDQRAAYAAEQAWTSYSEAKKLRYHYSRAAWWTVVTGNGFIKTHWDTTCIDKLTGEKGDIKYGSITPFHLFVPDLRESDIEDQPFVINAYTKPVEWCYYYFAEELKGKTLSPSVASQNQILDEAYLNLEAARQPDSCIVYETWVKPGATKLLPQGGVIISIDNILINVYREGIPYQHGMYPFTKFEHIQTSTFYADSPLVDLNQLQREYNVLRSEIAEAGKRMAKPSYVAQRGSIVPSMLTNEPGLVIEYKPGTPPPQPMPLSPLPQYYLEQQDRVLMDWQDLSGEKEVLRGSAPAGVTAGTAINYLQEAANQYHTPQYQSIEQGYEKIAIQTLELFVQYVDMPRKIRTIGADGAFDTILLKGADIASGTDVRIEPNSSVAKSKAAQEAKIMDMFALGLLPPEQALRLLELGGVQKISDTINVAEKKAQRENMKLKMLKPEDIAQAMEAQRNELMEMIAQQDPAMLEDPDVMEEMSMMGTPLLVPVDDFDLHDVHIENHNRFRMSQEYEILPPEVREQFDMHVAQHEQMKQQQQLASFLDMIPGDGSEQGGPPAEGDSLEVNLDDGAEAAPGATMSANGAVPDMAPPTEGAPVG